MKSSSFLCKAVKNTAPIADNATNAKQPIMTFE